jgi:carboxymethylenebutenolidase
MVALWDEHMRHEFETSSTENTLETMTDDTYVNIVPLVIGGIGKAAVGQFYDKHFIPEIPPDIDMVPVSRTVGIDRIADEIVLRFTHSRAMNWLLPGVAPTGKRVEMAVVVIVQFRDGKIAHEHVYWDQAAVLAQVGLLNRGKGERALPSHKPGLPIRMRSPAASLCSCFAPASSALRRSQSRRHTPARTATTGEPATASTVAVSEWRDAAILRRS